MQRPRSQATEFRGSPAEIRAATEEAGFAASVGETGMLGQTTHAWVAAAAVPVDFRDLIESFCSTGPSALALPGR